MTDINHIDGHKYNNDVRNLEYCTRSYNVKHADNHRLESPKTGENNGRATMTSEEVTSICEKLQEGKSFHQISEDMGWEYSKNIKCRLSNIKTRKT